MNGLNNGNTTLRELKKISKILILSNAPAIEKELSKFATTNDRKKMWVLIDGRRLVKEIAAEAGVTVVAVSYFLNAGVAAELIEYEKGKSPRKVLNYVPPSWLELVKLPEVKEEKIEDTANKENDKKETQGTQIEL